MAKTATEAKPRIKPHLCQQCGKNKKVPGYDICQECLEKRRCGRIPVTGFVILALTVFIGCVAVSLLFGNLQISSIINDANKYKREHRLSDCQDSYSSCSIELSNLNSKTLEKSEKLKSFLGDSPLFVLGSKVRYQMVENYAQCNSDSYAGNFATNVLSDLEMKDERAAFYYREWEALSTVSTISDDYCSSLYVEGLSDEEYAERAEKVIANLDEYLSHHPEYEYYILNLQFETSIQYLTPERSLTFLEKISKSFPEKEHEIYRYYISCYKKLGDTEKVVEWCRKSIDHNRNYVEPYTDLMIAYLDEGKTDEAEKLYDEFTRYNNETADSKALKAILIRITEGAEASITFCKEAEAQSLTSTELSRQIGLNYLALGEYGKAFDALANAYYNAIYLMDAYGSSMSNSLIQTTYASAILYKEHGKKDADLDEYIDEILGEGFSSEKFYDSLSDDIKDVLSGKVTCKDILTTGAGDFDFNTIVDWHMPADEEVY